MPIAHLSSVHVPSPLHAAFFHFPVPFLPSKKKKTEVDLRSIFWNPPSHHPLAMNLDASWELSRRLLLPLDRVDELAKLGGL